jgi:hypothetical protein
VVASFVRRCRSGAFLPDLAMAAAGGDEREAGQDTRHVGGGLSAFHGYGALRRFR